MQYQITVSRQSSEIIRAHFESKARVIPSTLEFQDILEIDIDNNQDLLSMFYAGIELAEQINNPKQWYYSEIHL